MPIVYTRIVTSSRKDFYPPPAKYPKKILHWIELNGGKCVRYSPQSVIAKLLGDYLRHVPNGEEDAEEEEALSLQSSAEFIVEFSHVLPQ